MSSAKKLNLADYRNDELVGRVISICDVKGSVAKILKITIIGCLIIPIFYLFLLSGKDLSPIIRKGLSAYAFFAAAVLGLCGGLVWLANSILSDAKEIVKLAIKQSQKAATDITDIKDGSIIVPAGRELIEQVYDELLLPIIEQVIAESFGLIGKPLLLIYRFTIGSAINFIIKKQQPLLPQLKTLNQLRRN